MIARRVHSDQGGALAPLFLFVALFLLWAALGILNTGQDASDRIKAQNAVDAVALMAGEQTARDLNVMAMNQVAATQSFTVALSSMALEQTLLVTKIRTIAAFAESYSNCSMNGSIYTVWYCFYYMWQMADYALDTFSMDNRYKPGRGVSNGNRLTKALGKMSEHLVATHPERVGALSRELADANGLEAVFVYPPCDTSNGSRCDRDSEFPGPSLPVEQASSTPLAPASYEMCVGIEQGSDGYARLDFSKHGFSDGKGPLTEGGSSSNPKLRDHINDASGISSLLPRFYDTMQEAFLIDYTKPPDYTSQQTDSSNEFLDAFDTAWAIGCPGPTSLSKLGGAMSRNPIGAGLAGFKALSIERPKNYWLKGRPSWTAYTSSMGLLGVIANAGASKFDDFALLYLGALTQGERTNEQAFGFDPDPFYAYAQSLTYNPQSHDLYTSLWGAELVPAFHMNDPRVIADAMGRSSAPSSFDKLQPVLAAASGTEWQDVNTH